MTQITPSISTRISHKFTVRRGWTHSTSTQVTTPIDYLNANPDEDHDSALTWWVKRADEIGHAENERRNQRDGWKPQETT